MADIVKWIQELMGGTEINSQMPTPMINTPISSDGLLDFRKKEPEVNTNAIEDDLDAKIRSDKLATRGDALKTKGIITRNDELMPSVRTAAFVTAMATVGTVMQKNPVLLASAGIGVGASGAMCLGGITAIFVVVSWAVEKKKQKDKMLMTLEESILQLMQNHKLLRLIMRINAIFKFTSDSLILNNLNQKVNLALVYSLSLFTTKELEKFRCHLNGTDADKCIISKTKLDKVKDKFKSLRSKKTKGGGTNPSLSGTSLLLITIITREIEIRTKGFFKLTTKDKLTRASVGMTFFNSSVFRNELLANLTIVNGLMSDFQSKCMIQLILYTKNPGFEGNVRELQASVEYDSYIIAKVEVPNTNYKYTNDVMDEITDKLVTVKEEAMKEQNEITEEKKEEVGGTTRKKRSIYINKRKTRRSIT
jgi:hypothetical protein